MTILVILLPVLVIGFIAVYRNQRDTADLPRVPFGFDAELGADAQFGPDTDRIRAELMTLSRWLR